MTDEEKNLLLNDLGARLQYGVMVKGSCNSICTLIGLQEHVATVADCYNFADKIGYPKPYLRRVKDMTDEEKMTMGAICLKYTASDNIEGMVAELLKFYCSHHLDYSHLIEKDLAIQVTEENNPYKKYTKETWK